MYWMVVGPLELWTADIATGQARKLLDRGLNTILEEYVFFNLEDNCSHVFSLSTDY